MAENTLTVQDIVQAGLERALAAANADGSKFINTGKEFIELVNGGGGDITVTINYNPDNRAALNPSGLAVGDRAVVVTAGEARLIGPFPPSQFSDSTNYAHMTFSGVGSLTVAVLRFTNDPG